MNIQFSKKNWITVGTNIVATLFLSIGLGLWIDSKLNTKPKFLLIMLGLSIAHVFILFWRITKNLNKRK